MNKFWNFTEPSGEEESRKLELYGVISEETWWGDEITPKMFKDELNKNTGNIEVYINSPGGDCIAATQIYTMLSEYKGNVTVKIDGLAASAASVVAMAGDSVLMSPSALMMIHNPLTYAMGNASELEKAIDILNEFKESIINAYELKTGMSRAKISRLMDDETWMNAKKAIEYGFADKMIESEKAADVDNVVAFAFATKKVEKSAINKIVAAQEVNQPKGTLKSELEKRLNILKTF